MYPIYPFTYTLTLLFLVVPLDCLKCYECNTIESCANFIDNHEFQVICPNDAQACSSQRKDNKILGMSCENIQLNDCKLANGIEYCYCTNDLCNNKMIESNLGSTTGDDEDLIEGSGKQPSSTILPNKSTSLHSSLIFIVLMLIN